MSESGESIISGSTRHCHICEEGGHNVASEFFCLVCEQCLCRDCHQLHKIIKATRQHEISSINELEIMGSQSLCDICAARGEHTNRSFFCLSCEQYLCASCKQYHLRMKATRLHEIKEQATLSQEIHGKALLGIESDSYTLPLCAKHDCSNEYFCRTHMEALCLECRLEGHGCCEDVTSIQAASKEFYDISSCEGLIQEIERLIKEAEAAKNLMTAKEASLSRDKQTLVDKFKDVRSAFDALLDKLEANAIAEIDAPFEVKMKQAFDDIGKVNGMMEALQKTLRFAQKAASNATAEERLIIVNTAEKELEKYKADINNKFTINLNDEDETQQRYIDSFKTCMSSLSKLSDMTVCSIVSLTDENILVKTGVFFTTDDDEELPEIHSYAVLENEKKSFLELIKKSAEYGISFHNQLL